MPQPLSATVPPPNCILCDGPASPPSRMGWLQTPDRQAMFCVCGGCSDCTDTELETKIITEVSGAPAKTDVPQPPAAADRPAWAHRAAAKWAEPLTRPPAA
jgi:hypothetical protein